VEVVPLPEKELVGQALGDRMEEAVKDTEGVALLDWLGEAEKDPEEVGKVDMVLLEQALGVREGVTDPDTDAV
jgi:hypothetical protein